MPENSLQIYSLKTLLDGLKLNNTINCKQVIKKFDLDSLLSNDKLLKDIDILFNVYSSNSFFNTITWPIY